MPRLPAFGIVALPALDLRSGPGHARELRSQLLMGEVVRVLGGSRDGRWWRVENVEDRYTGWARTWGLVPASASAAAAWDDGAEGRVVVSYAEVRSADGRSLVSPIAWRNRLVVGARRGARRSVRLADGREGWVPAGAVARRDASLPMTDRIRSLLGVPYLWGGRTVLGIDCSGFTQMVLAEQGIRLPRDAHDQWRACEAIGLDQVVTGDLLFFGKPRGRLGHVALALDSGAYAHARGCVRINSLDRLNALYDRDLAAQLRAAGRPREGAPPRPRLAAKTPETA